MGPRPNATAHLWAVRRPYTNCLKGKKLAYLYQLRLNRNNSTREETLSSPNLLYSIPTNSKGLKASSSLMANTVNPLKLTYLLQEIGQKVRVVGYVVLIFPNQDVALLVRIIKFSSLNSYQPWCRGSQTIFTRPIVLQ